MGYVTESKMITCDNDCVMSGCPGHVFNLGYHSVSDHFTVSRNGEVEWGADLNKMEALLEGLYKMAYYRVEVAGIIGRAKKSAEASRADTRGTDLQSLDSEATTGQAEAQK